MMHTLSKAAPDLVLLAGGAAITIGAGLLHVAVGCIVGGALLVALALAMGMQARIHAAHCAQDEQDAE